MHAFIKRFADGVFYPEEVEILIAAFDDAWAKLQPVERGLPKKLMLLPRTKFSQNKSSWPPSEGNVTPAT